MDRSVVAVMFPLDALFVKDTADDNCVETEAPKVLDVTDETLDAILLELLKLLETVPVVTLANELVIATTLEEP